MQYKDFVTEILAKSSLIASNRFGRVSGTVKTGDNNQVLTQTDLEIGTLIVNEIKANFPEYNIIDEDAGVVDNGSEFTWVVDPIDGTSNFANGIPTYGVMIGLVKGNIPYVGGVALPYFSEIYYAESGSGAFCNGQAIKVSSESSLLKSLVAYGIDGHQEDPDMTYSETKILADIILNIRNLRSSNSVFDMMMVAKGKYGGYLNRTSKIWDNVAPQIIIEEAGGIYSDFFGEKIDYTNPLKKVQDNFTCCGAPPDLHQKLQKIIKSVNQVEKKVVSF